MILTQADIQNNYEIEDVEGTSLDAIIERVEDFINEYTDRYPFVAEQNASVRESKSTKAGYLCVGDFVGDIETITNTQTDEVISIPEVQTKREGIDNVILYHANFQIGQTYQINATWGFIKYEERRRIRPTALIIAKSFLSEVVKLEANITSESVGRISQSFSIDKSFKEDSDVRRVLNKYTEKTFIL